MLTASTSLLRYSSGVSSANFIGGFPDFCFESSTDVLDPSGTARFSFDGPGLDLLLVAGLVRVPEGKELSVFIVEFTPVAGDSIGELIGDGELKNVEESRLSRRLEEVEGGREEDVLVVVRVRVRDVGGVVPAR